MKYMCSCCCWWYARLPLLSASARAQYDAQNNSHTIIVIKKRRMNTNDVSYREQWTGNISWACRSYIVGVWWMPLHYGAGITQPGVTNLQSIAAGMSQSIKYHRGWPNFQRQQKKNIYIYTRAWAARTQQQNKKRRKDKRDLMVSIDDCRCWVGEHSIRWLILSVGVSITVWMMACDSRVFCWHSSSKRRTFCHRCMCTGPGTSFFFLAGFDERINNRVWIQFDGLIVNMLCVVCTIWIYSRIRN